MASLTTAGYLALLLTFTPVQAQQGRRVDYVKTFMGTEAGGNMFPGVAFPFGMAKVGPDVNPAPGQGDPYSGYLPQGNLTGFSMMHESGTGGAPKYGVVSQLPVLGNITNPLLDYQTPRAAGDQGTVGYYKTALNNGITVELTASQHAGIMRHTFVDASKGANVLVDVSHFLPSFRGLGIEQHYLGGSIALDGATGRYTGSGRYNGGWNRAPEWTIFFCGQFDQSPVSAKTFSGSGTTLSSYGTQDEIGDTSQRVGAIFSFASSSTSSLARARAARSWELGKRVEDNADSSLVVESRIGISWISTEKACGYISSEIPETTSFDSQVEAVKTAWEDEVFAKATIATNEQSVLESFYTSLYGMFLIPSDRSGENPGWDSDEPYYDDIFTLWDTFRSHTPLFHILQPKRYTDFVRSLIDVWRHDGWMPDARSSNSNGRVQGGSNSDNVLADAFVKGVKDGVNWEDGFAAMVTNAEVVPPNTNDPNAAPDPSSTKDGRGALPDWKEKGFITTRFSRSVSRAVEYAVNDYSLYTVATGLGKTDEAAKYLARSKNWRNHWDTRMTIYGFSGFVSEIPNASATTPTFPSTPRSPLDCSGCYWADPYYQGLPYEYSFSALHDMHAMIELMGGDEQFVARLDKMFEPNSNPRGESRFNRTIFNPGNEPSFASPYLFNFVPGNQWRSVQRSRHVAESYYNTGVGGLPGNSDAGAMQSWLMWTYIGLYPLTGSPIFLVASPRVAELQLDLGDGKTLTITANGLESGPYVQSLKVNGEQWTKSWVSWDDVFARGGTMEFELGSAQTAWDTSNERPNWGIVEG